MPKVALLDARERQVLAGQRTGRDLIRVSKFTRAELDRVRDAVIRAAGTVQPSRRQLDEYRYLNYRSLALGYDELIAMLCEAFDGAEVRKKSR